MSDSETKEVPGCGWHLQRSCDCQRPYIANRAVMTNWHIAFGKCNSASHQCHSRATLSNVCVWISGLENWQERNDSGHCVTSKKHYIDAIFLVLFHFLKLALIFRYASDMSFDLSVALLFSFSEACDCRLGWCLSISWKATRTSRYNVMRSTHWWTGVATTKRSNK